MQKIVMYKPDRTVFDIIEGVYDAIVEDDRKITWGDSGLIESKLDLLLVDEEDAPSDLETVSDDLINKDQKEANKKVDLIKENESLKEKIKDLEVKNKDKDFAITEIYEMILGGGF